MNPSDWIDHGTLPPRRLPAGVDAALAYLADALGHVVYTRWTLGMIRQRHASLADAKAARPAVMHVLLDHEAAVEYWDRGRVRTVTVDAAPAPEAVLARVLHTHRRRFKPVPEGGELVATGEPKREAAALMTLPGPLVEWLARAGRFAAVASATNTLGVGDDAQAAALFLREFVPDGVPWAHLDIAGPAFNDGGAYGYTPKGGTGAAVRTLVQIALDVADGRLA